MKTRFGKLASNQIVKHAALLVLLALFMIVAIKVVNNYDKEELTSTYGRNFVKATVTEITQDNLAEDGNRYGDQQVVVRIDSGSHKGESIDGTSPSGNLFGAACKVGMKVIVILSESGDTIVATVYSQNRMFWIFIFVAMFVLMLGVVGGWKGIKSAIALAFALVSILGIFIPVMHRGYSPILASIILSIAVTIFTIYFVSGFSKKSTIAIVGTVSGVVLAMVFAVAFGKAAGINGYNVSDVESLIYVANNSGLKVSQLLFAGLLISALGAVMDVGMSIASAINEVHETDPSLKAFDLFKSGMNVGKDMMGTMSNTLILAFTGGSLSTLMLNYAYDLPFLQIINGYNMGIEIMQCIAGSIGIILTVPITSALTAYCLGAKGE